MAFRGIDDLHGYMKDATLPRIKYGAEDLGFPPIGHRSHRNTLSTRFSRDRHLTAIQCLGNSFDSLVNNWIRANVPDTSLGIKIRDDDDHAGERLTTPSSSKFNVALALPAPVTDFKRLCTWVDHFPLRTVQRIIHIIFPQCKEWGFVTESQPDRDDRILKQFYFTRRGTPPTPEIASNSVLVVCQPPWVLSTEDIWRFAELKSGSHLPPGESRLRGKERLWSKLWDLCAKKQCFHFVVTSYQQWVFGVFSDGWTMAYISPPLDARAREPTVMHGLLYWLVSALDADDGYSPPSLAEPVKYLMGQFNVPPLPEACGADAVSLSSWAGKSDGITTLFGYHWDAEPNTGTDVPSSEHVNTLVPLDTTEKGDNDTLSSEAYVKPRDSTETRQMVEQWRATLPTPRRSRTGVQTTFKPLPRSEIDLISPLTGDLFRDAPSTTASTEFTEVGNINGHWLASITRK